MIQTNKETRSQRTTVRLLAQVTKTFGIILQLLTRLSLLQSQYKKTNPVSSAEFPWRRDSREWSRCLNLHRLQATKRKMREASVQSGSRVFKLVAYIVMAHSDWNCLLCKNNTREFWAEGRFYFGTRKGRAFLQLDSERNNAQTFTFRARNASGGLQLKGFKLMCNTVTLTPAFWRWTESKNDNQLEFKTHDFFVGVVQHIHVSLLKGVLFQGA